MVIELLSLGWSKARLTKTKKREGNTKEESQLKI